MKKIILVSFVIISTFSINTFAGEGGIAGSASMIMNTTTNVVTDVATSIAIGKSNAHSNASANSANLSSFAGAAGGKLTITDNQLTGIAIETNGNLIVDQGNAMTHGIISLDAKSGVYSGTAQTAAP